MTGAVLEAADEEGVFRLRGQLQLGAVTDLLDRSRDLLFGDASTSPWVLDLSGLERADSAALALLLEWMEMAEAKGGSLELRGLPDALRRIARLSNVEDFLPIANEVNG